MFRCVSDVTYTNKLVAWSHGLNNDFSKLYLGRVAITIEVCFCVALYYNGI